LPRIVDLGAVIVDCADADPISRFYEVAAGAQVTKRDIDAVWVQIGGTLVIFREVEGYQPPTWPASDVPMQVHLDFFVDDLDDAERALQRAGATTEQHQPHRSDGLIVMRDPAGHLFCIGTRP
jgi:catechol 2,3-dioxygenase-like lactoylglutathione lyase family enzyme